jgi:hypothetical protein
MESVVQVMENVAVLLTTKQKRQGYKELALSRVGQVRINNLGSLMIIDEYNSSSDIWVRFKEGNMVNCTFQQFVNGSVKNIYDRSTFGVGYIGEGKYRISVNGEYSVQYLSWSSMMMRCYSKRFQEKHPTYIGCTIADEWHNFQNFATWYDQNYYEITGYRTHLDKDILVKGNKTYSSDTCVFVPQFINGLFIKGDSSRGDLPIGVRLNKSNPNRYEARCNDNGQQLFLGSFTEIEDAFHAYKEHKEQLIKDTAKEHKGCIPNTLYNAMVTYKVEIND